MTTWCFCAPLQWLTTPLAGFQKDALIDPQDLSLVVGQVPSLQQMHHLQPLTDDFNIANIHKYPDTQSMVYLPTFAYFVWYMQVYISTIWDTKHTHTHHLFIEVWKSKFKESPKFPAPVFQDPHLPKCDPWDWPNSWQRPWLQPWSPKKQEDIWATKFHNTSFCWRILED